MSDQSPVDSPAEPDKPAAASSNRRDLLGKGAVAAALAAVTGVALAKPAGAAPGGNMIIGANVGGTTTNVTLTGGSSLVVTNGVSDVKGGIVSRQGAGTSTAILGSNSGTSGVGVLGEQTNVSSAGVGVLGQAASGIGVIGRGSVADIVADRSGYVWLSKHAFTAAPVTGAVGAIARDDTGSLWYCYAAGKWRKLAGAGTAGSFHPIEPVRVYDSRAALPTPGAMARITNRVISVKDARNAAGTVTGADVVPAGATAVTFNVTCTSTTGANYLSVTPGDTAATPNTSTLNWPGGIDLANASTVKLDANRQIKIFMGDQPGSAHVIVDITGYYL